MKTKITFVAIAVVAFLLTSCSIEKRHYRDGFYIAGLDKKESHREEVKESAVSGPLVRTNVDPQPAACTPVITEEHTPVTIAITDLNTGEVNEAGSATQQPGATDQPGVAKGGEVRQQVSQSPNGNVKKAAPANGEKSQLAAFLLCFFFGILGIHRFYLGYVGIGLFQLFTLGGFGIWWIIDLIRIAFGGLKPKGGEYK